MPLESSISKLPSSGTILVLYSVIKNVLGVVHKVCHAWGEGVRNLLHYVTEGEESQRFVTSRKHSTMLDASAFSVEYSLVNIC